MYGGVVGNVGMRGCLEVRIDMNTKKIRYLADFSNFCLPHMKINGCSEYVCIVKGRKTPLFPNTFYNASVVINPAVPIIQGRDIATVRFIDYKWEGLEILQKHVFIVIQA